MTRARPRFPFLRHLARILSLALPHCITTAPSATHRHPFAIFTLSLLVQRVD
jgi:hypothetical protein